MLNVTVIVISLIVSTIACIHIWKVKRSTWFSMLSAFVINVLILGAAYGFLYNLDEESNVFGIDFHARYVLIVSIPVITWMNVIILSIVRNRVRKAKM